MKQRLWSRTAYECIRAAAAPFCIAVLSMRHSAFRLEPDCCAKALVIAVVTGLGQ